MLNQSSSAALGGFKNEDVNDDDDDDEDENNENCMKPVNNSSLLSKSRNDEEEEEDDKDGDLSNEVEIEADSSMAVASTSTSTAPNRALNNVASSEAVAVASSVPAVNEQSSCCPCCFDSVAESSINSHLGMRKRHIGKHIILYYTESILMCISVSNCKDRNYLQPFRSIA